MSHNEETSGKALVRWNRSTIYCAFLVAATAFTCPGIFGALNGLGAGGGASADTSNAANAIVFGCLAVGSLFVGGIANRITPRYALLNLGSSVGGMIALALNSKSNYRGGVNRATYIALMTIMCLGFPFALLLPTASKVERSDGRSVVLRKQPSLASEFKVLKSIFLKPWVWALIPLIIYAQWFLSFQWQFNFAYFTVRARALNSFLFYLLGLTSALLMGQLLDSTRWQRRTRAKIGFAIVTVLTGTSWILGQAVQVQYEKIHPTIDWNDGKYGLGAFVFALWGFSDPLVTTYMYWLVGSFSNDLNETSFLAAIMNSLGSVGSTFGFVVSAMDFNYNGACAINLALFFISLPGLAWVVFTKVSNTTHGTNLSGGQSIGGSESDDRTVEWAEKLEPEAKTGVQSNAASV
ncbi:UNC93-like protein [Lachnellula cervina]|uniref:UNC93-like protein n=1 Tax=Lachnellula cervina TaxID=1316786 RepID=A0A7D8YQM3_9HELO|nr:UNC93-like protein [Lachnellula cervina]